MRFIVDETPTTPIECDVIDIHTFNCPLSKTICDLWKDRPCRQLISYPDYIREREKQCCAQMEGHAHDT